MGLIEVMSARVRSLNLPPSHLKVSKSGKENTGSYAGVTIKEVIGDPVDASLTTKHLMAYILQTMQWIILSNNNYYLET